MPRQKKKEKTGKEALNLNQRKFCELYATSEEFFGHGTNSYVEAYNPKRKGNWYNTAKSNAYKLLTNTDILLYINKLLEDKGLNDGFVDKQLLFLINQHADLKSKLGGIKEYNQLKQRIQQRLDITSAGERITGINYIIPKENGDTTNSHIQATPGE